MATSTLVKGFAGALTAAAICAAGACPVGATTLTLTDAPTQLNTPETVTFTKTKGEAFVKVQGYQVPDLEYVTNNTVTVSGGGPNLLGPIWRSVYAAQGSNAWTYNDGSSVPGLGFAAQNPPLLILSTRILRPRRALPTPTASTTRTTRAALAMRLRSWS